mmetsp:Transcript_14555/g.26374  ORF Transcript_14555/g.26374 Transcript_14555/m.26374 type:complete len:85 (-) Transcript_14555:51-305(-)
MIFAMILELFKATDTMLVFSRRIGKKLMESVRLEEERITRRKIARQNKDRKMEDMAEKFNENKKEQNRNMNSIFWCKFKGAHIK